MNHWVSLKVTNLPCTTIQFTPIIKVYWSFQLFTISQQNPFKYMFLDVSTETFMSAMRDTPEQRSLSSSIDELNEEDSPKSSSSPDPVDDEKYKASKLCPKAWPSCPELSIQENIWQMRQPAIERRKRPSSLYQMKFSTNSPRSSVYSPRSSGYWSELEQLSESETYVTPSLKQQPAESPSPLHRDKAPSEENEIPKTTMTNSETEEPGNKFAGARQMTRGVFQQRRFKPNRTRSSECLSQDPESCHVKTIQRINSMPVERHTKKVSENNRHRKAFMTDV